MLFIGQNNTQDNTHSLVLKHLSSPNINQHLETQWLSIGGTTIVNLRATVVDLRGTIAIGKQIADWDAWRILLTPTGGRSLWLTWWWQDGDKGGPYNFLNVSSVCFIWWWRTSWVYLLNWYIYVCVYVQQIIIINAYTWREREKTMEETMWSKYR